MQSEDMRLKVQGMFAPKLPSCPVCMKPMRLVTNGPHVVEHPDFRTFECLLCRKVVTEVGGDQGPNFWPDRANEARAIAAQLTDLDSRRLMLEIAATYDHLAKKAEEGGTK